MLNPFMNDLCRKIESFHKGASDRLDVINELPAPVGKMIVKALLEAACLSQHVGHITAARRMMSRLPTSWLTTVLHDAINGAIDLNDEWEYRRLIELLMELKSELLEYYLNYGIVSESETIHEVATDFKHC